ncbi:MAG: heme ABC transporter ATP-binding protein [Tenericutes bacterium GWC2_34_14]|nr:MAG: heme ABC transporter ATP-binding protein [Tenericutes bacterium GWC2_34_14]OHE33394.1 MAG: heme ABC transporter ATP-binding protein [Tenericutes bacterium GWE2_34_108]OHE37034.1 MAG: heme ABC transporter ATP-binding protein [Tenericutes bacterium GWF1_35_14]OHE38284.1 MAG: heme ABC transporter ATP-binding protein [Tenericutes bacterium GWF2_35_184]OHE44978.1 MAG: heme ABC transporter ATP-binding protein [Tenericutes bacterium RIFOXYA2_FULL_36_32]OHE46884.1 MAG: heme ABC transporter ATP
MQHITKRFPGIVANDDVNFTLRKGEIHALLGENGAGKSTLMSILFGMYIPEEGKILKDGKPIQILNPNDANAYGIGMVHQHFKLVEVFSILDNIIMGVEPNKFGFIKRKEAKEHILELCKQYELLVDVDAKIQDVSVGMQQRTEILKMLYRQNDILIFDEPTAVLTPQEIKQLMVTMKNLINEGKSIIFITHKLDEIMEVSDRVTVLRRGKVIGTVETSKTTKEDLSRMMVGRDVVFEIDKKAPVYGETALEVNNLIVLSERTKKHVVDNVSFKVRKGEIVCVAGVDGNGQSELGLALSGLIKPVSGEIKINGEDMTHQSIRYRNDHGLSHIPEDRHKHGLILQDNLANNLALKKYHLLPYQNHGIIQPQPINELADELIKKYDIRSGQGVKTRVGSMSGGNQQKAIIAREIDKGSDVLLSIQTVRGLDVGAVEFAHRQLIKARDEGKAILMISFELDEVMSVSDRILVMYDGQIVKNVLAKDITVEELGLYMAGVKREEDVMTLPDVRKVKEEQNHE